MQWTKDTTGVIRSRTSKRYRQCNGQKTNDRRTNTEKQNSAQQN